MKWIKNTDGKPDSMLTFAIISFAVITLNIMLSSVDFSNDSFSLKFNPLDSGTMAVYLGATFSAYVGRRWTDKHYSATNQVNDEGNE